MCSLTLASIGLTALSGYQQYKAQDAQTKAQVNYYNQLSEQADQNAKIQERKGEQVSDQYLQQQQKLNSRRRLLIGQQAASAGASGLTSGGSVTDVMGSTIDAYNTDSKNLLQNQRNDTWSNYLQVVNYRNQGNEADAAASNARSQGKASKWGTILGTATSIANIAGGANWGGGKKTTNKLKFGGYNYQNWEDTPWQRSTNGVRMWGGLK
nr:MAG TPA: hypothetical protein [Caudoviricetes sp.]